MASLDFDGVGYVYEGSERPVRALDGLDLHVAEGEPVSVIGPSGCGKSTMLLLGAGLLTPTGGRVVVDDARPAGPRLRTALILQDYGLLPWKTVAHNAALGLQMRRIPSAERATRTTSALAQVGLGDFANSFPGELSGGMRQRLGLARALALDADLLLMDEPLSALDALTREDLQDVLLELWRERGHTAVLVTHSIAEAVFLGRRVIVMSPRPGSVAAVVDNPGMGDTDYRMSETFFEKVTEVRGLLVDEGALHAAGVRVSVGTAQNASESRR